MAAAAPDRYSMTRGGRMFIFANDFQESPNRMNFPQIRSVEKDKTSLQELGQSDLNQCQVQPILENRNVEEMEADIKEISEREDNTTSDFLVLAFLTYGDHGLVYGSDSKPIALQSLLAPLKADKCLGLAGKPKIIIMQTSPIKIQHDGPDAETVKVIPSEADFLYLWTRLDADKTMCESGSLFISHLVEQLRTHRMELDVLTIMTRVIAAVENALNDHPQGREILAMNHQLPFSISQLRKKLFL